MVNEHVSKIRMIQAGEATETCSLFTLDAPGAGAKIRDVLASHPSDHAIVALHKYKHAPIGDNVAS